MADQKATALSELSVPTLDDIAYMVDNPGGTPVSAKLSLGRLLGLLNHIVQGRLTLESGVPVSSTDQTAKSTLYFTPYNGNLVSVYDGSRWLIKQFTELSLALTGLTADKNYDVFLTNTPALELSAAWTNDTTRATAIAQQDSVDIKSGDATRRWLGTIRAVTSTTTEDSLLKRFVWNKYNRVRRKMLRQTPDVSWTYSTVGTWRSANADNANRLQFVVGVKEDPIECRVTTVAQSTVNMWSGVGLALDATNTNHADLWGTWSNSTNTPVRAFAEYAVVPSIGFHYIQWVENIINGAGTVTFSGIASAGPFAQFGLIGFLQN